MISPVTKTYLTTPQFPFEYPPSDHNSLLYPYNVQLEPLGYAMGSTRGTFTVKSKGAFRRRDDSHGVVSTNRVGYISYRYFVVQIWITQRVGYHSTPEAHSIVRADIEG
eukprot:767352-Hanusia_phi.AAC.5